MRKNYFFTVLAMLFCCLGMHAAAELTFSNVSLAPGSSVAVLSQDQQITFNTNMDAQIGYMLSELKDETKGEIILSSTTVYDPNFNATGVKDDKNPKDKPQNKKDPHFTFVCPSTTKLIEGHTYSLIFYAYADKASASGSGNQLASGSIKYEGATPAYVGSRFKLLNITPDLKSYIINGTAEELQKDASKRSVTLHFNGKVRMDKEGTLINTGSGTSAPLEAITPGADKDTVITIAADGQRDTTVYASSWTLTVAFSNMSDGADVLFSANAYDKAGLHVCEGTEYSMGDSETSFYTFTVSNDYNKIPFNLSPAVDDASVSSLYSFYVDGVSRGVSIAGIAEPAVVYQVAEDGTKTQVAQVTLNAEIGTLKDSGDDVPAALRLFLDKPVTKAGKYIVSFPRNYFMYGSNMMAEGSPATTFEYTIAQDMDISKNTIVKPADIAEGVAQLEKLTVKYGALQAVTNNPDGDIPAYIFDEQKNLVTTGSLEVNYDTFDENEMNVKLKEPVTKPGKYTFIIPENAVIAVTEEGGARAKANKGIEPDPDAEAAFVYAGALVQEIEVKGGSIDNVTLKTSLENKTTLAKIDGIEFTFEGAETVATSENGMVWWKSPKLIDSTNPYYDATYAGNSVAMMSTPSQVTIEGTTAKMIPWNGSSSSKKAKYVIDTDCQVVMSVPAGFFIVNGINYPQIDMIFTVDTATGINGVEAEGAAAAKQTYTLTGIKVNGKPAQKGVFIVNGKKVVLK